MEIMLGWTIQVRQNFAGELKLLSRYWEKGAIEHPELVSCFPNRYSVYLATFGIYP